MIASFRTAALKCNQETIHLIVVVQPRLVVQCTGNLVLKKVLGHILHGLEKAWRKADHTSQPAKAARKLDESLFDHPKWVRCTD